MWNIGETGDMHAHYWTNVLQIIWNCIGTWIEILEYASYIKSQVRLICVLYVNSPITRVECTWTFKENKVYQCVLRHLKRKKVLLTHSSFKFKKLKKFWDEFYDFRSFVQCPHFCHSRICHFWLIFKEFVKTCNFLFSVMENIFVCAITK